MADEQLLLQYHSLQAELLFPRQEHEQEATIYSPERVEDESGLQRTGSAPNFREFPFPDVR